MFSQGISINTHAMYDILLEYGTYVTPTSANILQLMTKAGQAALVRNSNYSFQKIVEGMGIFWKKISKEMLGSLYAVTKPTKTI